MVVYLKSDGIKSTHTYTQSGRHKQLHKKLVCYVWGNTVLYILHSFLFVDIISSLRLNGHHKPEF